MFDRFINWSNVIITPVVAASFGYYIYVGHAATLAVWLFAFLGLVHTFLSGLRGIANN